MMFGLLLASLTIAAAATTDVDIVTVSPGELHKCADTLTSSSSSRPLRCVLERGVYRDDLYLTVAGGGRRVEARPLEIVGAGSNVTILTGTKPVTDDDVTWSLYGNSTTIYQSTALPAALRVPGIRQAFGDGVYIPEAR